MKKSSPTISIRELKHTEIPSIYGLIHRQNSWMTPTLFKRFIKEMLPQGYRVAGVFQGKKLIGCSGFWLRTRFWCGRQLDIDNFIIHPDFRRDGIGSQLLAWLEQTAIDEQCKLIVLDTYVTYAHAQKFYMNQGYALTGFHMTKIPGSTALGSLPFSGK